MKKFDLLITGVGGQGVVLARDIIGEAALAAGYDAKKTDTLGMAQRGGSVVSHVRIGKKVWSPLIKEGDADIMLAFEKLEAARWGHYLKPGGTVILNNYARPPLSVNMGNECYPTDDEILGILRQRSERIHFVEGTSRAMELGNIRALNMFMLGCVSLFLPLPVSNWLDNISQHVPPGARELNVTAFNRGRKEIRGVHLSPGQEERG
jgi:indolepyruvate ferredoxin oxidoreductase beta subunit